MHLAKQMGILNSLNKQWFAGDFGGFKGTREQANMIKEKLIAYLCKVMKDENKPTQGDYLSAIED
jgi:hypothetical protein